MFKGKHCASCHVVEPIIRKIVTSSGGSASLTFIDSDEEKELTEKYNITTIPVVLYNDKKVLTAEQAGSLISSEMGSLMGEGGGAGDPFGGLSEVGGGVFEMQGTTTDPMQSDPASASLNFDQQMGGSNIFSSGQSGLFNHLFNELITASVESNAEALERSQKFNMLSISQKTMTPEAIQNLTRPALGDYVHIGVLQSIVTSILSINPRASEFLWNVGNSMGKFGNVQFRFLTHNPRIIEHVDVVSKFRDIQEGLQDLYSANSLGLPLYLASRSLVEPLGKKKARLTVYDSAFCAQMSPIGRPVCHLISGEIAGLLETTLGEEHVSVVETKCYGLGNPYCQFDIELGKKMDFRVDAERPFLTKEEKELFQESLDTISKNMYDSSLVRTVLRPGVGDYVHISVLQQAINGIKFSDPFFSTLLYYAGLHYGLHGADYAILERIIKEQDFDEPPLEFEDGIKALVSFFNDPARILTRWQGNAELVSMGDEDAVIRIHESAISAGLEVGVDFVVELEKEQIRLENFTTGFIQGRLQRILDDDIRVDEITDYSGGSKFCEFKIELD
jgi:predicted hydrocarbon binding protein